MITLLQCKNWLNYGNNIESPCDTVFAVNDLKNVTCPHCWSKDNLGVICELSEKDGRVDFQEWRPLSLQFIAEVHRTEDVCDSGISYTVGAYSAQEGDETLYVEGSILKNLIGTNVKVIIIPLGKGSVSVDDERVDERPVTVCKE